MMAAGGTTRARRTRMLRLAEVRPAPPPCKVSFNLLSIPRLMACKWDDVCRLARFLGVRLPNLCFECWGTRYPCEQCRKDAAWTVFREIQRVRPL